MPITAIDNDTVKQLLSEENLRKRTRRTFEGFEIVNSLDGKPDPNVEISLVKLTKEGQYPQHVHNNSDASIVITAGSAYYLSGTDKVVMHAGDRMDIPRGTPHGFELLHGQEFEFISVQCPPIKDEHTGKEDFHLVQLI